MPRTCTVCTNTRRAEIDAALVAGASYRVIARQFSVGHDSLKRHVDGGHIQKAIRQAQETKQEAQALDIVKQLDTVNKVATSIMVNAFRDKKTHGLALAASDRILKQLDFQHRVNEMAELTKEVEAMKQLLQASENGAWQP